ncbi:hypothetical protein HMPREF1367_02865 [Enterococcus faecium ERV38]|nr:hypothetical protein HMPREF1367_02865 [Enterococcus faecium ERV38]EPI07089.1 hypothetical protein D357_02647 [Enterococcus faecium SD3B-2]
MKSYFLFDSSYYLMQNSFFTKFFFILKTNRLFHNLFIHYS